MGLTSFVSSPLFGVLLAPVVTKVVDFLKSKVGKLDSASPLAKQAVAVGVATVGVLAGHAMVGVGPDTVTAAIQSVLTPDNATAIITAALGAVAVKHGEQKASQ